MRRPGRRRRSCAPGRPNWLEVDSGTGGITVSGRPISASHFSVGKAGPSQTPDFSAHFKQTRALAISPPSHGDLEQAVEQDSGGSICSVEPDCLTLTADRFLSFAASNEFAAFWSGASAAERDF